MTQEQLHRVDQLRVIIRRLTRSIENHEEMERDWIERAADLKRARASAEPGDPIRWVNPADSLRQAALCREERRKEEAHLARAMAELDQLLA